MASIPAVTRASTATPSDIPIPLPPPAVPVQAPGGPSSDGSGGKRPGDDDEGGKRPGDGGGGGKRPGGGVGIESRGNDGQGPKPNSVLVKASSANPFASGSGGGKGPKATTHARNGWVAIKKH